MDYHDVFYTDNEVFNRIKIISYKSFISLSLYAKFTGNKLSKLPSNWDAMVLPIDLEYLLIRYSNVKK